MSEQYGFQLDTAQNGLAPKGSKEQWWIRGFNSLVAAQVFTGDGEQWSWRLVSLTPTRCTTIYDSKEEAMQAAVKQVEHLASGLLAAARPAPTSPLVESLQGRWRAAADAMISEIEKIDKAVEWQPSEPEWWLKMMMVYRVLLDNRIDAKEL